MNRIDWKKVSKSPGYRSLKAAYIRDVEEAQNRRRKGFRPMRDKAEYARYFKRSIGYAMHYAHRWNIPLVDVLNHWEEKRDYWWLNFYQPCHLERCRPSL